MDWGQVLSELADVPALVTDADCQIVYMSGPFEQLTGFVAAEVLGKGPPHPWWGPQDHGLLAELCCLHSTGPTGRSGRHIYDVCLQRADGRRVPAIVEYQVYAAESGDPLHVTCFTVESEARARGEQQQLLARVAELTRELSESITLVLPGLGGEAPARPAAAALVEEAGLSQRELEVLDQLRQGGATGAIAAALHISSHTVRNHTKAIFRKLQVHSRIELMSKFGRDPR